MKTRDRLRIAIQKSGRLSDPARDLLARAGLSFRESRDRLFCFGESLPIDLLLVRDDDIPGLIAEGVCDLGVVGCNVLQEQALERSSTGLPSAFSELRALGFGACRLAIAAPQENEWRGIADLAGKRIATSYPRLLAQWLAAHAIDADVVMLSGSVEIAPRLGKVDAICDLVSSGATLVANQLREVQTVLETQAVLAGPAQLFTDGRAELTIARLCDLYLAEGPVTREDHGRASGHRAPRQAASGCPAGAIADARRPRRAPARCFSGKNRLYAQTGTPLTVAAQRRSGRGNSLLTTLSAAPGFTVARGLRADNPATGITSSQSRKSSAFSRLWN